MKKIDSSRRRETWRKFCLPIGKLILKIREGVGWARGERFEKLQSGLHVVPELIADDRRRKEMEIRGEDRVEEQRIDDERNWVVSLWV